MSKPSFVYVTYIATTPEKLWAALTDGKFTREYWGGKQVDSDWKPGSPVHFLTASGEPEGFRGTVLEVTPLSYLAMSWSSAPAEGKPQPPATKVSYAIDRAGPLNVKLTVIHEELEPGSEVDDRLRQGWPAILSSLKSFLETGEGLDSVKRWARAHEGK